MDFYGADRELSRRGLLQLYLEEAHRSDLPGDRTRSEFERFAGLLGATPEAVRAVMARVKQKLAEGALASPDGRPFDPVAFYERALEGAFCDGELAEREMALLSATRQFLAISKEQHLQVLSAVRTRMPVSIALPRRQPPPAMDAPSGQNPVVELEEPQPPPAPAPAAPPPRPAPRPAAKPAPRMVPLADSPPPRRFPIDLSAIDWRTVLGVLGALVFLWLRWEPDTKGQVTEHLATFGEKIAGTKGADYSIRIKQDGEVVGHIHILHTNADNSFNLNYVPAEEPELLLAWLQAFVSRIPAQSDEFVGMTIEKLLADRRPSDPPVLNEDVFIKSSERFCAAVAVIRLAATMDPLSGALWLEGMKRLSGPRKGEQLKQVAKLLEGWKIKGKGDREGDLMALPAEHPSRGKRTLVLVRIENAWRPLVWKFIEPDVANDPTFLLSLPKEQPSKN